MNPRTRSIAGAALIPAIVAAAGLVWALFWPDVRCSSPGCARQRFSLFVELDAMEGVTPLALEVPTEEGRVSVRSVMASGGIQVSILQDQNDVPYDHSAGYLDRADLHQLATAWRNRTPPAGVDAKIYALLAPRLIADTGEALFGIMFDHSGREGLAVAPQEMVDRFAPNARQWIPVLQLRTFIHELLHAMNRSHLDATQFKDDRLTIEAPTKCIADTRGPRWSLAERPLFALSPRTIEFFQGGAVADVLPGAGYSPYDVKRSSARVCQEIRAGQVSSSPGSRWALAWRRLKRLATLSVAEAAEQTSEASQDSGVNLRLQAMPAAYPLGYPIAVRLIARNESERPVPLKGRLMPGFGLAQIDIRSAGEEDWRTVLPTAWYEPIDDDHAMLEPGDTTEQTVPIYFGEEGWTFPAAGDYELRARLKLGDEYEEQVSDIVLVQVAEPGTERDAGALQVLLTEDGQLDPELGEILFLGAQIGSREDVTPLERITAEYPDTTLGAAMQLPLAARRLRRPLDPATGTRAAPDVAGARQLLSETCTDSGVAALKYQLLLRHRDLPLVEEPSAFDEHVAWDGSSRDRQPPLRTYSDPELIPARTSVHFCSNEVRMRGRAWTRTLRLAHQLRERNPERVVVVGHADSAGTCSYNDELGLKRAEAVKLQLVKAGIPAGRIAAVTLGKRRPLDFSAAPEAHSLNRRVEFLISRGPAGDEQTSPESAEIERAIPACDFEVQREPAGAQPRRAAANWKRR